MQLYYVDDRSPAKPIVFYLNFLIIFPMYTCLPYTYILYILDITYIDI